MLNNKITNLEYVSVAEKQKLIFLQQQPTVVNKKLQDFQKNWEKEKSNDLIKNVSCWASKMKESSQII